MGRIKKGVKKVNKFNKEWRNIFLNDEENVEVNVLGANVEEEVMLAVENDVEENVDEEINVIVELVEILPVDKNVENVVLAESENILFVEEELSVLEENKEEEVMAAKNIDMSEDAINKRKKNAL
jgi:hypothetical protein